MAPDLREHLSRTSSGRGGARRVGAPWSGWCEAPGWVLAEPEDVGVPGWVAALERGEEPWGPRVPSSEEPGSDGAPGWAGRSESARVGSSAAGVDADGVVGLAPGVALARLLDGLDPEVLSDGAVVEGVAGWARVAAWVHGQQVRWAGSLAGRGSMNPVWSDAAGGAPAQGSVAGDELAMRLGVSRRAAQGLVDQGRAFAGALSATGEALAAGRIDAGRAKVLVDRLGSLPLEVALAVEDRVLPGVEGRTVWQVRRDVERALVEVDGGEAVARHRRARGGRRVDHPRLLADGMAGLWCVLPAGDAARVDGVLDGAARAARSCGDPRTLDQLRADGLRDLVVHGGGSGRSGQGRVEVQVTVALSTLLGVDDGPGHVAGLGPVDALQARALAAGGVWRRIVTDPLTGGVLDVGRRRYRPSAAMVAHVRARDVRCGRPGCEVDARCADLDHTVEFHGPPGDPSEVGSPGTGSPGTGTTSVDNLGPLCRRDHRLKTDGGYTLRQPEPGVFEWTTPTGHRYRNRPGADTAYQHRPPAPLDRPGGRPALPDPGPPPF